jgi:ABC-type branched-subunit amino acid transport system substrate-binding protein
MIYRSGFLDVARALSPALALALGAFTAAGCADDQPVSRIKVVGLFDHTGASPDPARGQAAELAIEHVNRGLAMAGYKDLQIELSINDHATDPARVVAQAQEGVATGGRLIVIDQSAATDAANVLNYDADLANDLDVPILCGLCASTAINNPTTTNPDPVLQEANRNTKGWVFQGIMPNTLVSKVLVQYMLTQGIAADLNGDGELHIVFYGTDEGFTKGFLAGLKASFASLRPAPAAAFEELLIPSSINPDSYDWNADLSKIRDATNNSVPVGGWRPDYLVNLLRSGMLPAYVRAAAGSTLRTVYATTARIDSLVRDLGAEANGVEGVSHLFVHPGPSADLFLREYEAVYGLPAAYRAPHFYDLAFLGGLAIVAATKDLDDPTTVTGAQIAAALRDLQDPAGEVITAGAAELARAVELLRAGQKINYEGASGPLDFDANLSVRNNLAHFLATDGRFEDLEVFDCISGDDCKRL